MTLLDTVLIPLLFIDSCLLLFVSASMLIAKSRSKLQLLAAVLMLAGALSGFYLVYLVCNDKP